MPTATTSKPRKTAKPKSADTCRLSVTIRGVAYTARSAPRPSTLSAFGGCGRRTGPPTPSPTRSTGRRAIAATFVFRHDGHGTHCKHVRALRALGLIDPEGEDPAEWPAWTDSHAFTITR
jgi:hypothetical protein